MQLEQQESFRIEGPQLEVFGQIESKLPASAKKRPAAVLAIVLAALVAVFGIGMTGDLALRADAAANLIRLCGQVLGTDDATVQAAQGALDGWNAAADAGGPADQFAANTALGGAVTAMYQQTDAAGGVTEAISGQYTEFLSRQDIILRTAANDYNPAAQEYNDTVSGFPANVIGLLWGAGEVQLFQ